ncbi:hypothetical protein DV515_00000635 [Chloebia gouldiae]|uniref:Uncharacterized protein n=1 Tax=Chloebia gouldiae TaxID=44316 RepID=A0A3L8T1D8_CHLGU|nr:hypothetical protein DV515_00000635 [Chloebia gouldiae]
METKAKFGPSPSGRARQSPCLRQRRGRPEGTRRSSDSGTAAGAAGTPHDSRAPPRECFLGGPAPGSPAGLQRGSGRGMAPRLLPQGEGGK